MCIICRREYKEDTKELYCCNCPLFVSSSISYSNWLKCDSKVIKKLEQT